jgi:peptidoglycan/LPS O-acetylase OafA/YrhL
MLVSSLQQARQPMRSSTGAHFVALDHVRAVAAFMVFAWHFVHGPNGWPVQFNALPAVFPLVLLDEGHTGVALFMTLSGYLFAKLLDGKAVDYRAFLWNRALRLLPLLCLVILIVGIGHWLSGRPLMPYVRSVIGGVVLPTLPNGGWSIAVEFHFYLVLPLILWLLRRKSWLPLAIIATAIAARVLVFFERAEVQSLAYWTIVGRIDQFVLGILAFHFRGMIANRHLLAGTVIAVLVAFFVWFDVRGGFYHFDGYPCHSAVWIVLPTIEGLCYAAAIAWYETSFSPGSGPVSRFVGRIGEYSYSMYLLHFFVVFKAAQFIDAHVMDLSSFYVACVWALVCFLALVPVCHLTFEYVEAPFLALRRSYVRPAPQPPSPITKAVADTGT